MHNNLLRIYHFIEDYEKVYIKNLDKNIGIIFRNYNKKINIHKIIKIKEACKLYGKKFYLSNNIKLSLKLGLNGVYIPSFNKNHILQKNNIPKNFLILGSAHNYKEIKAKEKQGCSLIFISPLFKIKKTNKFLNIHKFNFLSKKSKKNIIALGGLNKSNIKKINLLNVYGFASINLIKKNGLNEFRPFLKFLNYKT